MSNISCVAIDLDGTLLDSAKQISAKTQEAIKACAERGVHIVLATTRNPDATIPYARLLGLHSPLICSNGAQVWATPDGPLWSYHTIPYEVALEIARFGDQSDYEISTTIASTSYFRQRPGQSLGTLKKNIIVVPDNIKGVTDAPVRMFVFEPDAIDAVEALCHEQFADVCRTQRFHKAGSVNVVSLGVFPREADKSTALDTATEKLDVKTHNVMAIGDDLNDISMLKRAGLAIAMGNAHRNVKRIADAIAPDHDNDGVSWALHNYVLKQSS